MINPFNIQLCPQLLDPNPPHCTHEEHNEHDRQSVSSGKGVKHVSMGEWFDCASLTNQINGEAAESSTAIVVFTTSWVLSMFSNVDVTSIQFISYFLVQTWILLSNLIHQWHYFPWQWHHLAPILSLHARFSCLGPLSCKTRKGAIWKSCDLQRRGWYLTEYGHDQPVWCHSLRRLARARKAQDKGLQGRRKKMTDCNLVYQAIDSVDIELKNILPSSSCPIATPLTQTRGDSNES